MSIQVEESDQTYQIIFVYNDVPTFIEEKYSGFVIKKFSKNPSNSLTIGLIDDYTHKKLLKINNAIIKI